MLLRLALSFLFIEVLTNHSCFAQEFAKWPTLYGNPPTLMGHCGERFYLPEHTIGAYELAAIEGTKYQV